MTSNDQGGGGIPALGQPPLDPARDPDAENDPDFGNDPDFAGEHQETAVDKEIITGADTEREPESPRGWSGGQR